MSNFKSKRSCEKKNFERKKRIFFYMLLIHMFKKITKLSCSFFCNFDCFHMREPSGFLMLLLLLFFEPRRFLFSDTHREAIARFVFTGTHFILSAQLPDYFWLLRILFPFTGERPFTNQPSGNINLLLSLELNAILCIRCVYI